MSLSDTATIDIDWLQALCMLPLMLPDINSISCVHNLFIRRSIKSHSRYLAHLCSLCGRIIRRIFTHNAHDRISSDELLRNVNFRLSSPLRFGRRRTKGGFSMPICIRPSLVLMKLLYP